MLLSNCAICGKKKPTFIKNKAPAILKIFQMNSSKYVKSLTNFISWEQSYAKIVFEIARVYL